MSEKIKQEVHLNRISGPFDQLPPNAVVSPLGLVPKKASGQFRLIHDLSFPKLDSVNSHIDSSLTSVQYETLDTCLDIIRSVGKNCLIAKSDIKDAFRIIPIHPDSRPLLGFMWNDQFYIDMCLPMGCSISCNIFERFSSAIQDILISQFKVTHMSHILDDFIFFGPQHSDHCLFQLRQFESLASFINLPIKAEKTVLPSTCVSLHGIEVDTVASQLRLPADKLADARVRLDNISKCKKVTLRTLQSLIGVLSFACRAVVPGRAFLRRLINLTCGIAKPHFKIRLTREARKDLEAWQIFLSDFNGRVIIQGPHWVPSADLSLYSDASGFACAGVCGAIWFTVQFPDSWEHVNIVVKEILPIYLLIKLNSAVLSNKRILFHCDNNAVVAVINSSTCKDSSTMSVLRQLVIVAMSHNISVSAVHIPGRHNVIPDLLSRLQVTQALIKAPWLDKDPTPIPPHWLPWYQ